MLTVFIVAVVFSVGVSALCSLTEAALYAVPLPHVKHLAETGSPAGRVLLRFKGDIGKPISAILVLNTIANTAGAAIAGWAAAEVFGGGFLPLFSVLFTLVILYCSEITPKVAGVVFCRPVARAVAFPLAFLVRVLAPLIKLSQALSRWLQPKERQPSVSQEEVLSMATIGIEEGALDRFEGSVITNVIGLDQSLVRDVLTPRVVVFRREENLTFAEVEDEIADWSYSRVPIFEASDPDHLFAYVTQRDIYRELLRGEKGKTLGSISRPLETVPELMRVDRLLLRMFEQREQICAVVDEHGGLAGIITLEDVIEEIVGREIVDEYDTVSDLRTFAKLLRISKNRKRARSGASGRFEVERTSADLVGAKEEDSEE